MSDFIPPPRTPPEPSDAAKLFGALLMAVGVLIATLCGLCSLAVGAGMIGSTFAQTRGATDFGQVISTAVMLLFMIGIFGGVPFAVGVALVVVGQRMRRGR